MTKVYLYERTVGAAIYYTLKHRVGPDRWERESVGRTRKSGGTTTKAEAEERRKAKERDLDDGKIPTRRPRGVMTFGRLKDEYQERRVVQEHTRKGFRKNSPRLEPTTIAGHLRTLRYLAHHFGDEKRVDAIDERGAERFLEALAAGELEGARRTKAQKYAIGEQTVRGHIRNAKAVYTWAALAGLVPAVNPFAVFDGAPIPSAKRKTEVPLATVDEIIAVASPGWGAMLGLCRLAGLRREEARSMPWAGSERDERGEEHRVGVDWDRGLLCIVGRHKGKRSRIYREVPIEPRLEVILAAAFDAAPDGAATVTGLGPNNLVRDAHVRCKAAGVKPWPDFFQAMRTSRENDLKVEGFAEATYCTWMGHGASVSRKHYVSPTEAEIALVTERRVA